MFLFSSLKSRFRDCIFSFAYIHYITKASHSALLGEDATGKRQLDNFFRKMRKKLWYMVLWKQAEQK